MVRNLYTLFDVTLCPSRPDALTEMKPIYFPLPAESVKCHQVSPFSAFQDDIVEDVDSFGKDGFLVTDKEIVIDLPAGVAARINGSLMPCMALLCLLHAPVQ